MTLAVLGALASDTSLMPPDTRLSVWSPVRLVVKSRWVLRTPVSTTYAVTPEPVFV